MFPRIRPRCVIALPLLALSFAHAADRPKLTAEKWSADINVPDPVACSVDDQGRVFVSNAAANCVACHRFARGSGSEVGPPLETIASRHDRRYLLKSLVDPGAQVVLGFGLISVTKKNGESVAGTLLADDAESVRLRLPDGREISVPRDGITSETPAVSMMPPMGAVLNRRQIRDVVAYLATLKPALKQKKAEASGQH